jgi:hypothetical protein
MALPPSAKKPLREWTTSQTSPRLRNYSGLDLEKKSRLPVEAELFFLTSLFIELIDGVLSANALRVKNYLRRKPAEV